MPLPEKFVNVQALTPGKNARVFRAKNSYVNRDAFIKIYPIPEDDSLSALREPQLLQELQHQNLTRIYAADPLADGVSMLLEMELIAGGSVQNLIDLAAASGAWPSIHECIRICLDVAAGLSCLHARGYVHRDIKPANLMVRDTPDGRRQGVVTDLGLASKLDQSGRAFASKHARIYRPPEVWNGSGYSKASDIYQLGLVLFQLLGGSVDYTLSDLADAELKAKALSSEIVEVDSVSPHVDESLRRVLRNCLCSEASRLQSTQEVVSRLTAAKVKHLDWRFSTKPGGFYLERTDASGAVYRVDVNVNGSNHTITRKKRTAGGQFRNKGHSELIDHDDLGRCQKFRRLLTW